MLNESGSYICGRISYYHKQLRRTEFFKSASPYRFEKEGSFGIHKVGMFFLEVLILKL